MAWDGMEWNELYRMDQNKMVGLKCNRIDLIFLALALIYLLYKAATNNSLENSD